MDKKIVGKIKELKNKGKGREKIKKD